MAGNLGGVWGANVDDQLEIFNVIYDSDYVVRVMFRGGAQSQGFTAPDDMRIVCAQSLANGGWRVYGGQWDGLGTGQRGAEKTIYGRYIEFGPNGKPSGGGSWVPSQPPAGQGPTEEG